MKQVWFVKGLLPPRLVKENLGEDRFLPPGGFFEECSGVCRCSGPAGVGDLGVSRTSSFLLCIHNHPRKSIYNLKAEMQVFKVEAGFPSRAQVADATTGFGSMSRLRPVLETPLQLRSRCLGRNRNRKFGFSVTHTHTLFPYIQNCQQCSSQLQETTNRP